MFSFSRIDQGIVCVRHEGPISLNDSRQFRAFLKQYRGKLLIDMRGTPPGDVMREMLRVRPMLPQAACIGTSEQRLICDELPGKDIYINEVQQFANDAEALAWLRGKTAEVTTDEEVAAA